MAKDNSSKKVIIVGAGFGGLSAACYMAKAGYSVTVIEKNDSVGGRAMHMSVTKNAEGLWQKNNSLSKSGKNNDESFRFDLGPSWYMMPDVFDDFFAAFGKKTSDYYELLKLDPSYKVFTQNKSYDVHDAPKVYELFDRIEPGSPKQLEKLLASTKKEYESVRAHILDKSMLGYKDVATLPALKLLTKPELLGSYHGRIKKYIKNPELQKIVEFMVVFMGGSPKNIPGLYTLLTHVDMGLGIWYPKGGINKVVEAMYALAKELGVKFEVGNPVTSIVHEAHEVTAVQTENGLYNCDIVIANADYHHVETVLLKQADTKWEAKTLSPSGLLIYLGLSRKIPALRHHNMFFDVDWDSHFTEVFDSKTWSKNPLFYVGVPSVTDENVAPKGYENIFILAPMANGNQPSKVEIDATVDKVIARIEKCVGEDIKSSIVYKDVRAQDYFKQTFNAYKGNAFGLAHTFKQSAMWRPKIKHKNIKGLYFVGHYTNPGTGVPIVTLSGKVVSNQIIEDAKT